MKNKSELLIRYSIFAIFGVILFSVLYPLIKYSVAWGESMFFPYKPNNFWGIFFADPHGWMLLSFVEVFTNKYMPQFLNIHHQDYMAKYNIYIIMLIYFAFLWALLKQFEKYITKKSISALALFILFPLAIILQCNACGVGKLWWMNHDLWFYSYNMNPIFPILLFGQWEKYYVTGQTEFSTKEKIYNGILIFLTATGHEFFRIVLLVSLPLIFLSNNLFISEKFKPKTFFKFYSVLFIFNLLICLFADFQHWLESKLRTAGECFSILVPYLKAYCKTVLFDNLFLFALTIGLVICTIYLTKNSETCKKLLITNFSLISAILLFNVIIITGVEDYEFAFNHPGVQFLTKTMLLFSVLSFAGYIFTVLKERKHKIYFGLTLTLICLIFCVTQKDLMLTEQQGLDNKEFRQKIYLSEKLYTLTGERDKTIYLPDTGALPDFVIADFLYAGGIRDNLPDKISEYKIIRVEDTLESMKETYENVTGTAIDDKELDECLFENLVNKEKQSE